MCDRCWSNESSSYFRLQIDYETQSADSFMANWSSVLIRLAEPFMDANYTKVGMVASNEQFQLILFFSLTKLTLSTTCTLPASTLKTKRVSKRMLRRLKSGKRQRRRIVRAFLPLLPLRMILTDSPKQVPHQTLFPKSST